MKWYAVLIAFILLAYIFSMLTISNESHLPEQAITSTLTPHAPISVDGNGDFSAQGWPGSGTLSNPYTIKGLNISATFTSGIFIQNTNAYFVVSDCYIQGSSWYGIYLYNCVNGVLKNNTCLNNEYGICLYSSDGNILGNNSCKFNNEHGIYICSSDSSRLCNNSCISNNGSGIRIDLSEDNLLISNSCKFNAEDGVSSYFSSNNDLTDNICSNNVRDGAFLGGSHYNTLFNNAFYSNGFSGITIELSIDNNITKNGCFFNYIDIQLTNYSSGNTLNNNSCWDSFIGIYLDSSSSNTLSNNSCTVGHTGIYLLESNYNTVRNNNCSNSVLFGIRLENSGHNKIWNNTFIGNNGAGSVYDFAHVQASEYDDSMFFSGFVETNQWYTSGSSQGYGNYWGDWAIPDNNRDGIVDIPYETIGDLWPLVSPPGVDITPPFTTSSISGTIGLNGWYVSDITISFSAIDNYSGVNHTDWSIDTVTYATSYDKPFTLQLEGYYNLSFHSFDNAGNLETSKRIQIKQDTNVPISAVNTSGQMTTIDSSDNASGINSTIYRIDNGEWMTYDGSFLIAGAGNHTIEYYSIDKAGNKEGIKTAYKDNGIDVALIVLIGLLIASAVSALLFQMRKKQEEIPPPPDD